MSGDTGKTEELNSKEVKTGVFVCHCGSNIAGLLDCEALTEYASKLPNVVFTKNNLYTCSEAGIGEIMNAIKEQGLTRVVVASCSPRTHMPLFKSACAEAGLNPYLFEMANIRDQCSWVHVQEKADANLKARDLIRMAVAKAEFLQPQQDIESSLVRRAVVIGGGIAGLSATVALANMGTDVVLVERAAELGGLLRRINRVGPRGDKASELMGKLVEQVKANPKITPLLESEVTAVGGVVGNYEVTIRDKGGAEQKETVGCIVVATGAVPFTPEGQYGYNGKNVITQIELEEKLRDGTLDAKRVVMIQCVGARSPERTYCARICCQTAIKNALYIKELNPEAYVHILYRDIQMYGTDNERMLWESRGKGVRYDIYNEERPPVVKDNVVEVYQPLLGEVEEIPFDLLVLSTPLVAPEDAPAIANLMRIPVDQNGFFMEAHAKLRPWILPPTGFSCAARRVIRQRFAKLRPRDSAPPRGPVRCSQRTSWSSAPWSLMSPRSATAAPCVSICVPTMQSLSKNSRKAVGRANA